MKPRRPLDDNREISIRLESIVSMRLFGDGDWLVNRETGPALSNVLQEMPSSAAQSASNPGSLRLRRPVNGLPAVFEDEIRHWRPNRPALSDLPYIVGLCPA